jgi:hypothetical protein
VMEKNIAREQGAWRFVHCICHLFFLASLILSLLRFCQTRGLSIYLWLNVEAFPRSIYVCIFSTQEWVTRVI